MAIGPLIGAVERVAFAPAAAGDDDRCRLRLRRTILHNQIGTVGYELSVNPENRRQRAFHLRGGVVLRLQPTDGRVNQLAQDGQVCENGGTYAEVWLHLVPNANCSGKKVLLVFAPAEAV